MTIKRNIILFILLLVFILPVFSQNIQLTAFSNTSTIKNNDDAINYLADLFQKFPIQNRDRFGPEIGGEIEQIRMYNPLNNEKLDCVIFTWNEKLTKIDEKTNYPININVSLKIMVPLSIYLRNYRQPSRLDNTEQLFELLRQSNKFLLHVKTGVNLVGNNFEVKYSSPGYIEYFSRENPYFVFRKLLDVENHTFPNHNLLDLTDRETVISSLSKLLSSNRPFGFNNGNFILFIFTSPYNKTFIDLNKIGENPPFDIQHYRKAITSGKYQNFYIETNNFVIGLNILFNESELQMFEKLPRSNELDQLARRSRSRFNGSYYYIGTNEFIALLKRSLEFQIKITKIPSEKFDNENDLFVEFKTQNYDLIPGGNLSQSLTQYINYYTFRDYIVKPLETINTAIENNIKFVWKNNNWDYE